MSRQTVADFYITKEDKMNILVTGASKGIGKAIAQELKPLGNIYATGRNEKLLKELEVCEYFVADLAKNEDLLKLGEYVKEKHTDVLINNAGEYFYKKTDEITIDKIEHMINVNLKAPMYLTGCAAAYMKKSGWGRIVNIGSISGVMVEAGACCYSATKSGLIGLSKSVGLELAQYGITVNTINPGWVDTDLGNSSAQDCDFTKEEIIECIPQRRFVSPEEVAKLVKYLISDSAKGITGQSINLCAGLSVGI